MPGSPNSTPQNSGATMPSDVFSERLSIAGAGDAGFVELGGIAPYDHRYRRSRRRQIAGLQRARNGCDMIMQRA